MEGGAAARGHSTTQDGPPRAGSGTDAARSPPPARRPGETRRTTHYWALYTSRKRAGLLY